MQFFCEIVHETNNERLVIFQFALSLFFAYICLVILAFVVFILFYSDAKTGVSIQTVLQTAVKKYHDNRNMAELMDTVQMQVRHIFIFGLRCLRIV